MDRKTTSDGGAASLLGNGRARLVADELRATFAAASHRQPPSAYRIAVHGSPTIYESGPATRPPRRAGVAVAAAVLLMGGAAGLFVASQHRSAPVDAPPPRALNVTVVGDAALAPAVSAIAPPLPVMTADVAPAAIVEPRQPAQPARGRPTASRPDVRRVAVKADRPARRATAPATPDRARRRARPEGACASLPPSARPRCLFSMVSAADSRLRDAYESAAEVGVPSSILAEYRGEWDDLRRRAGRDPLLVADSYRTMSRELDEYAGRSSGPG